MGKVVSTITTVADAGELTTRCARRRKTLCGAFARGATSTARRRTVCRARPTVRGATYRGTGRRQGSRRRRRTSRSRAGRSLPSTCPTTATFRRTRSMPAFVFSNDGQPLHRVYISTDRDCVNIVHIGSIVGGTAYAPASQGRSSSIPRRGRSSPNSACSCWAVRKGRPSGSTAESVCRRRGLPSDRRSGSAASASGDKTAGPAPVDLWDNNWGSGLGTTGLSCRSRSARSATSSESSSTGSSDAKAERVEL